MVRKKESTIRLENPYIAPVVSPSSVECPVIAPSSSRPAIHPNDLNVILATDCGSTTTKAILIEKVDGVYRQTHRGEAPTTVE